MSDLISREKAFVVLSEYYHHRRDLQHLALRLALSRVPSAEPERKKGEWIKEDSIYETVTCSVCHGVRRDNRINHINFCNCCGADMRGEQNG